jgi:hypothetical protein
MTDAIKYPLTGPLTLYVDRHIIRIADKVMTLTFKFTINHPVMACDTYVRAAFTT